MVAVTVGACSGPNPTAQADNSVSASAAAGKNVPTLDRDGWTSTVYDKLTEIISGSQGQGKKVVFDFDNTT